MPAYLPILTMICLVVLFIAASFTVSQLLGPRRPNAAKQAPYESGIVPEQEPSERFPVKFYLVAMTFIVLDVEIIFLYPFTTIFRNFVPAAYGLGIMGVFYIFGTVGFDAVFAATPGKVGQTFHFLSWDVDVLTTLCLLLFLGAMGASQLGAFTLSDYGRPIPQPGSAGA